MFNTRTVKYILKLEPPQLLNLLELIGDEKLPQLFELAVSNNYHTIDDYKHNLNHINQSITNKKSYNYGYQFTERPA